MHMHDCVTLHGIFITDVRTLAEVTCRDKQRMMMCVIISDTLLTFFLTSDTADCCTGGGNITSIAPWKMAFMPSTRELHCRSVVCYIIFSCYAGTCTEMVEKFTPKALVLKTPHQHSDLYWYNLGCLTLAVEMASQLVRSTHHIWTFPAACRSQLGLCWRSQSKPTLHRCKLLWQALDTSFLTLLWFDTVEQPIPDTVLLRIIILEVKSLWKL